MHALSWMRKRGRGLTDEVRCVTIYLVGPLCGLAIGDTVFQRWQT